MTAQPALFPSCAREKEVMRQVREYLTLRRLWFWRNNTGAYEDSGRYIRYGVPGMPDFTVVLPDGRTVWIECKSERGRQTRDQKIWEENAERHHQRYIIARSLQDLLDNGL